jgi:hypothetical protein
VNAMEAQLGTNTVQKLRQHSITRINLSIVPKEDTTHMCRLVRMTQGSELLLQGRASWQVCTPQQALRHSHKLPPIF